MPDLKWDCKTITNLYLTAIVNKQGLKSLRDLTAEHLPLLRNILEKGSVSNYLMLPQLLLHSFFEYQVAISEKYGLPKSQLRIFLHYQPSYYHLHVHFTSLHFIPAGCSTERAHLLSTVINNLALSSSYYQTTTLNFVAFEGDHLLQKLQSYGNGFQGH